jgi:hypothetical protein
VQEQRSRDLPGADGRVQRWLSAAWLAVVIIVFLQAKALWGIGKYRDLTGGDTSDYFSRAYAWYERGAVDIVWSPLYTAYYGTVYALLPDAYAATILHRVIIVMLATLGVLLVMRTLLPPAIALAVAAWWAILPINFNTLYEVHLFALLPILAIWLVVAYVDGPWGRGTALALFLLTAVLVRNELLVGGLLFLMVCIIREIIDSKAGRQSAGGLIGRRAAAYLVPAAIAMSICLVFYSRSTARGDRIAKEARLKHALNMSQVYAFGYSQRHSEWKNNPWTDCYGLAEATFGEPTPSLRNMIARNPRAVLEHFAWNLMLLPAGLQLALFNGTWGGPDPDYAPVEHPNDLWSTLLALAACVTVTAAGISAFRARSFWWKTWFASRQGVLLAMFAVAAVSVPIILTQRPRPSYLFGLTCLLMAVIGFAAHVLLYSHPRLRDLCCLAFVGGALMLTRPYFPTHPTIPTGPRGRPLKTAYDVLRPLAPLIENSSGMVILGYHTQELRAYLHLKGIRHVGSYAVLDRLSDDESIADFLDASQITVFFIPPGFVNKIRRMPGGQALLADPMARGWEVRSKIGRRGPKWVLLYR